jgi:FtsK/SpoIIIE family
MTHQLQYGFAQSLRIRTNSRAYQIGLFIASAGLFCALPFCRTPQQKLLVAIPAAAASAFSLRAGRDHYWSDRAANAFVLGEDEALRDALVRAFKGNPGMQQPAMMDAELVDEDSPLVAIAAMEDEIASAILLALVQMKIDVTADSISDRMTNDSGIGYLVRLPAGVSPSALCRKAADIQAFGRLPVLPVVSVAAGGISVILPRPKLKAGGIDDPMAKQIESTLKSYQAEAIVTGKTDGLAFDRYTVQPNNGVKFGKIAGLGRELLMGLGLNSEPLISATADGIALDVARSERGFVNYADYIDDGDRPGCQVPIGVDQLTGELVWMDFADSNTPHACFAGGTGSGKSEALRGQVKYVVENHKNSRLLLIDVKASTFSEYEGVEGVAVIENAVHGAIAIVEMAAKMEKRRTTRKGFKDVATYNEQSANPLPRILIYVEELKDMLDGLKTCTPNELEAMGAAASQAFDSDIYVGYGGKVQIENEEGKMVSVPAVKPESLVMMALGRIGQAGRSESIHLALITQEPDKNLLDSLIGNLPAKVALRLNSFIESNVILPGKNAHCEKLLGKGDLLYSVPGQELQRIQSLWVG